MAFPLTGSALTTPVVQEVVAAPVLVQTTPAVQWNKKLGMFPPAMRSAVVQVIDWEAQLIVVHAVPSRQWNGIGGTIYLPSFPQLDRKETTFPHAT